jgi:hypothetical protein
MWWFGGLAVVLTVLRVDLFVEEPILEARGGG